MSKTLIRHLKCHYGSRWRMSQQDHVTKALTQLVKPGTTTALEFSKVYHPVLNASAAEQTCTNLLAMNPSTFKYKTFAEIEDCIVALKSSIETGGRLLVSFNYQFVNYNRLRENFHQGLENMVSRLEQQGLVLIKNFTKKRLPQTSDWGDCFFVFEKNKEGDQ